jgi:NitT/TauT family transport system permease protein
MRLRGVWEPLALTAIILILWELAPTVFGIPKYILPKVSSIALALFDTSAWPQYLENASVTLAEAMLGLAIGTSVGLISGVLLYWFKFLDRMTYPLIIALQSVPKVAIAPLFVVWLGFGISSKVLVVVLLVYFPVLVNTLSGLRSTDPDFIELFAANNASRLKTLTKLLLPAALPSILAGFEVAVTVSLLGAIVGEFVGAQKGLGVMLLQAQYQLNTAAVFALVAILAVIGIVLNFLVRTLRRRTLFWVVAERKS